MLTATSTTRKRLHYSIRGPVEEVRLRKDADSATAAWQSYEWDNINSPSTWYTVTDQGAAAHTSTGAQSLAAVQQAGIGLADHVGAAALVLSGLNQAGSALVTVSASASQTLPSAEQAASATHTEEHQGFAL